MFVQIKITEFHQTYLLSLCDCAENQQYKAHGHGGMTVFSRTKVKTRHKNKEKSVMGEIKTGNYWK